MESGRIIGGKYRLTRELGEGAMGLVWAATHEMLGREVAIKFLLPTVEQAETAAARFVAEAKAAARVKHRFVVDVFDFGITEDGLHYMVQELLDGVSLADCMCEGPAWPVADVLRFMAQCLSGLEAVHQIGIVHRDLKPENIFVMRDPEGCYPKLLDFGISKVSADLAAAKGRARPSLRQGRQRRLTAIGTTVGTPAYMSPEQLCGASSISGSADLYSVGVVLYEWLSGRVPHGDVSNPTELYRRIAARSGATLRTLRPDLDPGLCALVDKALDPEPQQRFASALEMRHALLRVAALQTVGLSVVQRGLPNPAPVSGTQAMLANADHPFSSDSKVAIPGLVDSRRRLTMTVGALLLMGAVIAVGLRFSSSSTPGDRTPSVPTSPPASRELAATAPTAATIPSGLDPGSPEPSLEANGFAEPTDGTQHPVAAPAAGKRDVEPVTAAVVRDRKRSPGGAHQARTTRHAEHGSALDVTTEQTPAATPPLTNDRSGPASAPAAPSKFVRTLDF